MNFNSIGDIPDDRGNDTTDKDRSVRRDIWCRWMNLSAPRERGCWKYADLRRYYPRPSWHRAWAIPRQPLSRWASSWIRRWLGIDHFVFDCMADFTAFGFWSYSHTKTLFQKRVRILSKSRNVPPYISSSATAHGRRMRAISWESSAAKTASEGKSSDATSSAARFFPRETCRITCGRIQNPLCLPISSRA